MVQDRNSNLVIASDVVYDWRRVKDLIKTLKMLSECKNSSESDTVPAPTILVAIQRHDNESYDAFYEGIEDIFDATKVYIGS